MRVPSKVAKLRERSRARDERRDAKREELARGALETLAQLGYARTSLRDIAEQTNNSVGLIHYYFEDKVDLIEHCVRLFKRDFIAGVDQILDATATPEEAVEQFVEGIAATVRDDARFHRLWDDILAQAMFEPRFQGPVREIEDSLIAMIGRFFAKAGLNTDLTTEGYVAIHGAFHIHLFHHLSGDPDAIDDLRRRIHAILDRFRD